MLTLLLTLLKFVVSQDTLDKGYSAAAVQSKRLRRKLSRSLKHYHKFGIGCRRAQRKSGGLYMRDGDAANYYTD